jgi:exopolysaccharide production protein ExoZ
VPGGLDLIGTFSLTNANAKEILIYPAWTLPFELAFYLAFSICLYFGRPYFSITALAVVGSFVALGCAGILPPTKAWIFKSPNNICFLLGVFVGAIALYNELPKLWFLWAITLFFYFIGFILPTSRENQWIWWGFGTAFLILALLKLEFNNKIPKITLGLVLGNASYAIYLIHVPLIFILGTTNLGRYIISLGGSSLLLLIFITILLLTSIFYYKFVELPFINILRVLIKFVSSINYIYTRKKL